VDETASLAGTISNVKVTLSGLQSWGLLQLSVVWALAAKASGSGYNYRWRL